MRRYLLAATILMSLAAMPARAQRVGPLESQNNLSDVSSTSQALVNLGFGASGLAAIGIGTFQVNGGTAIIPPHATTGTDGTYSYYDQVYMFMPSGNITLQNPDSWGWGNGATQLCMLQGFNAAAAPPNCPPSGGLERNGPSDFAGYGSIDNVQMSMINKAIPAIATVSGTFSSIGFAPTTPFTPSQPLHVHMQLETNGTSGASLGVWRSYINGWTTTAGQNAPTGQVTSLSVGGWYEVGDSAHTYPVPTDTAVSINPADRIWNINDIISLPANGFATNGTGIEIDLDNYRQEAATDRSVDAILIGGALTGVQGSFPGSFGADRFSPSPTLTTGQVSLMAAGKILQTQPQIGGISWYATIVSASATSVTTTDWVQYGNTTTGQVPSNTSVVYLLPAGSQIAYNGGSGVVVNVGFEYDYMAHSGRLAGYAFAPYSNTGVVGPGFLSTQTSGTAFETQQTSGLGFQEWDATNGDKFDLNATQDGSISLGAHNQSTSPNTTPAINFFSVGNTAGVANTVANASISVTGTNGQMSISAGPLLLNGTDTRLEANGSSVLEAYGCSATVCVNWINMTGGVSGGTTSTSTVAIGANGSDSNLWIKIAPKGTGSVLLSGPAVITGAATLSTSLNVIGTATVTGAVVANGGVTASSLTVSGAAVFHGVREAVRQITTTTLADVATNTDYLVAWNTSMTGVKAETIPACTASNAGQVLVVKDEIGTAGTYPITVTPVSGTIEGASTDQITVNYAWVRLTCDGIANWILN